MTDNINKIDIIDKIKKNTKLETYCKEFYKSGEWIEFKEFKNLINKFSDTCEDVMEEEQIFNLEDINEEDLISEYNDIHIHRYFRFVPAFLHRHDFFEITYVYEGECFYYMDGKEIHLKKGDIIIVPPYVRHATRCSKEVDVAINIVVRKSTFDSTFLELLRFNEVLSDFFGKVIYSSAHSTYLIFHTNDDVYIKKLVIGMMEEEDKKLKYNSTILNGLLTVFFGYLMRNYEDSMVLSRDFNDRFEKFDDIIEYIFSNYNTVTLDSLAEHFKFNKYYLSKVIKSYTGKNFVKIVQETKMRRAIDLMINTNLSIEDISSAIGYNSSSTFIRTFKKINNISPTEYRKRYKDYK